MAAVVLRNVPNAVAVDWAAAVSIDVNWASAELAFVLAVFAVDAVPAAAVFTSVDVCPAVDPPVAPCQNASQVACRFDVAVLAVPLTPDNHDASAAAVCVPSPSSVKTVSQLS